MSGKSQKSLKSSRRSPAHRRSAQCLVSIGGRCLPVAVFAGPSGVRPGYGWFFGGWYAGTAYQKCTQPRCGALLARASVG